MGWKYVLGLGVVAAPASVLGLSEVRLWKDTLRTGMWLLREEQEALHSDSLPLLLLTSVVPGPLGRTPQLVRDTNKQDN